MSSIEDATAAPVTPSAPSPEVSERGLEYHRLALLRPRPRWWKPLLTGLLGIAFYLAILVLVVVPLVVVSALVPGWGAELQMLFRTTAYFQLDRPWLLVALVLPLILMIPALLLASRVVQGRGVGLLSSVTGRLRMDWLGRTLGLASAVFVVYFAVVLGWSAALGDAVTPDFSHPGLLLMVVLLLVLIPFQAAAEESSSAAISCSSSGPGSGTPPSRSCCRCRCSCWGTATTCGVRRASASSPSSPPGSRGGRAGWRRRSRCTS
ncbi:hypothetical protein V8Z62_01475 [Microbacterium paraoxydans]|uniref:Uncharacterized protein n=1 Tax=Microbacterium paraoxydans TaxID=199592 RepID=A0ABZ2HQS9_9MICO